MKTNKTQIVELSKLEMYSIMFKKAVFQADEAFKMVVFEHYKADTELYKYNKKVLDKIKSWINCNKNAVEGIKKAIFNNDEDQYAGFDIKLAGTEEVLSIMFICSPEEKTKIIKYAVDIKLKLNGLETQREKEIKAFAEKHRLSKKAFDDLKEFL